MRLYTRDVFWFEENSDGVPMLIKPDGSSLTVEENDIGNPPSK